MRVKMLVLLSLPLLWSGTTIAAEQSGTKLESISGKVLVDQGKGFVAADSEMTLKRGAKVFVGDNSSAILSFAQKQKLGPCNVVLKATSITTVSDRRMCETQQNASSDAFEAAQITPVASDPPPSEIPPPVAAGVFVAGVVGLTIFGLVKNDNNGTPISTP